jgi:phage terminase large subunit-like protein
MILTNGSQFKIFGTDKRKDAESLRGYQCHYAWSDELGTQQFGDVALQMLEFCMRLGENPQLVITTTPRPIPVIKKLVKDPDVRVVYGSTFDNSANLPSKQLALLKRRYENTSLGKQELYGKLLTEQVGALWSWPLIERARVSIPPDDLARIVVAIDPAGTGKRTSDETGIMVAGIDSNGTIWILEDATDRFSPDGWASKALSLYHSHHADAIIAETNFGADMVKTVIHNKDSSIPFHAETASRGKAIRAEPVVSLYERGRVKHTGDLEKLETQLCEWVPPGRVDADGEKIPPSKESPGRLDACVWAVIHLTRPPRRQRGALRFEE